MREITKDEDTKTDIFIESQIIKYAINPSQFKEDLQKAKNEVEDLEKAVKNILVEGLGRQFKTGKINEEGLESLTKALTKTENGKTLTEINKTEKALENTDEISDTIKKALEENKIGTDDLAKTNKVTVVNNISNYDSAKYRSRITNNLNSANKVKTSSQILDKELQKAGVKKPLYNCTAHHIVSDKMDEIVDFFNKYDIDINSASNGVYLPTKGAKTSEVGKAEESYKNLNQFQKDKKIKKAILDEMDNIKKDLLEGNLKINNTKLKN